MEISFPPLIRQVVTVCLSCFFGMVFYPSKLSHKQVDNPCLVLSIQGCQHVSQLFPCFAHVLQFFAKVVNYPQIAKRFGKNIQKNVVSARWLRNEVPILFSSNETILAQVLLPTFGIFRKHLTKTGLNSGCTQAGHIDRSNGSSSTCRC